MQNNEIKRLQNIINSPEFAQGIVDKMIEREQQEIEMLKYFYPDHASHSYEFKDDEYFDAMFVLMNFTCSCGHALTLTREMTEIWREKSKIV